jgi:hypothetical protein
MHFFKTGRPQKSSVHHWWQIWYSHR